MRGITLDEANSNIGLTIARAAEFKLKPLSIIVPDASGRVLAFHKQDGSALLRFEIADGKAFAAIWDTGFHVDENQHEGDGL